MSHYPASNDARKPPYSTFSKINDKYHIYHNYIYAYYNTPLTLVSLNRIWIVIIKPEQESYNLTPYHLYQVLKKLKPRNPSVNG